MTPAEAFLYAAAYRPVRRQEVNQIDLWSSCADGWLWAAARAAAGPARRPGCPVGLASDLQRRLPTQPAVRPPHFASHASPVASNTGPSRQSRDLFGQLIPVTMTV